MNQYTKNIISYLLAGIIILINLVEIGVLVHHFEKHIDQHNVSITKEDHSSCGGNCSHISKLNTTNHICDGHFLNFMPQLEFSQNTFEYTIVENPTDKKLFSIVKQYSSSYKHLFTSRGPPSIS